jgi:hypothetical protein
MGERMDNIWGKITKVFQTVFFIFATLDILGMAYGILSFNLGLHIDQQPLIFQYWILGSFLGLVIVLPVMFGIAIYYIFFD